MKTLIAAAMLLALTTPASAAKAKPQDFSAIRKWVKLHGACVYGEPTQQGCDAAEALGKKLVAGGYCLYGHGVVGKIGGRVKNEYRSAYYPDLYRTRCYEITNIPKHSDN